MAYKKLLQNLVYLLPLLAFSSVVKANDAASIWHDIEPNQQLTNIAHFSNKQQTNFHYRSLELETKTLQHLLNANEIFITVPMPSGEIVTVKLIENNVLPPQLAKKYPSIKSYSGVQVDNPQNYGRFNYSEQGFYGVFSFNNETVYIDPKQSKKANNQESSQETITAANSSSLMSENTQYKSYFKKDAVSNTSSLESRVLTVAKAQSLIAHKTTTNTATKTAINKIYRIAFATTGEYSQFHGGSKSSVLSAITTLVNRLNQVFEVDLGIKLQLAENSDTLIFLDSNNDPFENTDFDVYNSPEVLRTKLGTDNFDIGHVLTTGAGGLAVVAATCDNDAYIEDGETYFPIKAMGVTGNEYPVTDSFYIDFVAHELGHQLGAEHTFNGQSQSCWGGNRMFLSAVEPGSGSTIMSYAGLCGEENLQNSADDYFHVKSIEEITDYLTADPWQIGQSCGQTFATTNSAPVLDAGSDYTIPAQTPFTLTANATDIDNDVITYSFEQMDLGSASTSLESMKDDGLKPLFRSYRPSTIAARDFPIIDSVLSGELVVGENYATTNRELNFKITARDQQGSIAIDAVKLTVLANSSPFQLLSPSASEQWFKSVNSAIEWDVANTRDEEINCQYVNIDLSIDGGNTFTHRIADKVENNGEFITITPKINAETARLKISCDNNIFFAVSAEDFAITNSFAPDARADQFDVDYDTQVILPVLENDSDENLDDILRIVDIDYQGKGEISIVNEQLSYTPLSGFSGVDTFYYVVADNQGLTAKAEVSVNVREPKKQKSGGGAGWLWLNLLIVISIMARGKNKPDNV